MSILTRFADAFRAFLSGCPCGDLEDQEQEITDLQESLDKAAEDYALMLAEKELLADSKRTLQTKITDLMTENNRIQVALNICQRDYDKLKEDAAEAQKVAQEAIQGLENTILKLEADNQHQTEAYETLEDDYNRAAGDRERAMIQLNAYAGDNNALRTKVAALENALASYKEQNALWAKQVQDLQDKIKLLESQPVASAVPPPSFLEEIDCGPITKLFIDAYGMELLGPPTKLKSSDAMYMVTTLTEMQRGFQASGVKNIPYTSFHNCSEFAFGLLGWFSVMPGWEVLPVAAICHKVYVPNIDWHWRFIFACYDNETDKNLILRILEPQNYELALPGDIKVEDIDLIMMP